jgi:MAC/Perforin domain
MIGRWYYPRVKLILKECATASERFKTAIRNALDTYDRDKDINPLLTVFQEYGTVVPNEVILGGYMLLVHTEDYQGSVNEHEVRNTISAAVSIKAKTGEGSAGMSFQNGLGTAVTADRMSKATQFTVRGGDTTLASNPQQWPNTVKPASEWAVIGRSNLTPIVDWLPQDLRSRVTALWPKVPIPPAVWELEDHDYSATGPSSQDHNGKAERAQFVLGARIVLDGGDGARGAVQLVCGTSMTPELGRGDAAGGAASFHRYRANDIWIDTSSVCLPVPAGHHYAATTPDTVGNAPVRFAIAETNLTFDQWHIVGDPAFQYSDRKFTALTDGFVFCTVQAWNDGDRGYITCEVDKILVAAASVHYYQYHDCWIRNACFCAPYTKGSVVEVKIFSTSGQLKPTVWQIPSTSQAWKFTKPEPFKVGASVKAVTDGFLNGVMVVAGDGPRGTLRLDCVKDQRAFQIFPIASASTHVYHQKDRWISHSSAMVPVRKGNQISANANITSGAPQVQVYWTGVVPA